MPDAWVLKEGQYASWNATITDTMKVPAERYQQGSKQDNSDKEGMKIKKHSSRASSRGN